MNGGLQYSALARILTLNNQIHDLENQLLAVEMPTGHLRLNKESSISRIARIQDAAPQPVAQPHPVADFDHHLIVRAPRRRATGDGLQSGYKIVIARVVPQEHSKSA